MGWTYNNSINSKKELKDSITNADNEHLDIVGSGNGYRGFYVAYKSKHNNETFVVFYQTAVDGGGGCWGYKDMCLSSCPYFATDLPDKLLKFVNLEECADWYQIFLKAVEIKKKEKSLKMGDQFKSCGDIFTLTGGKRGGRFIAECDGKVLTFRKETVARNLV